MKVERTTHAAPDVLWPLVGDLEHWADLLPTMQAVERLGPAGPVGLGDRFAVKASGLPRATYEITQWQPGESFTWVSAAPGVRTTATHHLQTRDDGTLLTLGIDWSGPLAWLARLLLSAKARRMVEREAATFVELAEHAG